MNAWVACSFLNNPFLFQIDYLYILLGALLVETVKVSNFKNIVCKYLCALKENSKKIFRLHLEII